MNTRAAASRPWSRRILVSGLAVLVLGLAVLHLRYPLPYVYRVVVDQDPEFSDIEQFPARAIEASGIPSALKAMPDPRIAAVLERHSDVTTLEALLEETETTAFLVAHQGRLVEERYLRGHDDDSLQNTFSVSKSITSALVGLAIRNGLLRIEDPVTRHLPELEARDERFSEITLEHLLDMQSGIRYSSEVKFPFITSDNPLIYYHPDLESVLLERTVIASPPGSFQYNNYNPPLLGLVLRRSTGMAVGEYLARELWGPLGTESDAGWTVDERGFERMESGFHARGRDLVRFGLLYLNDGRVAEHQVLPAEWVRASTDFTEPPQLDRYDGRSWGYRAGWWLVPRPSGRSDFCAIGHFGQFIYVSPQYDAVLVRTGPGRGDWGDRDWTELFYFAVERF